MVLPADGSSPAKNYLLIREELARHSALLAEKPEVIVLNKMDLLPSEAEREAAVAQLRSDLRLGHADEVLAVSGATQDGTRGLLDRLWDVLRPKVVSWRGVAAK